MQQVSPLDPWGLEAWISPFPLAREGDMGYSNARRPPADVQAQVGARKVLPRPLAEFPGVFAGRRVVV